MNAVGEAAAPDVSRVARWTLVASILGSSMAFIDGSVVNVALPSIQADLGGGLATQQWVVDAYLLTLGSLILVGGSLGDIFGPRKVFLLGIIGFGLASVLCAVASGAIAQRIDAPAKLATPIANTFDSPKMSPSEPPTRMSDPSVSR